ncbi:DUF2948 family protein [uncultured Sneathiella sp.]|uniref:DUF2948 family protein n=1 Tax=uncultured Sneathiella sp. TaxID=879315 RepID=UPI0030EE34DB|tara:strand:- start:10483 stop:10956 length:474 start_codon:yes stop_codon:yes gene_type:complete
MPKGLKLYAAEVEDAEILSAALEGMITSPGEMSFHKSSRAFTIMGSRFMWEATNDDANPADSWYRIRSGLHFGDVMAVKSNGISQNTPTEALELLSMSANVTTSSDAEIQLNFAGGGVLLLKAECINLTLTDTGEAWQTEHKPQHEETNSPSDQDKE